MNIDNFSEGFPNAKIAKIIKILLEKLHKCPDTLQLQVDTCNKIVEWTTGTRKIMFL